MISEIEIYSIINYLAGDLSDEEKQHMENKLAQNPEYKAKFEELKETWGEPGFASDVKRINIAHEWSVFKSLQNSMELSQTNFRSHKIRLIIRYAAAAVILIATTLGSFLYLKNPAGVQSPKVEQIVYYIPEHKAMKTTEKVIETNTKKVKINIPKGERRQITLPDGSRVWLNSRSSLSYASSFNQQSRDVILEGEAYFEVAHNPTKPFHVKAKGIIIEVLGTVFNVSAYPEDEEVETALISGKISMIDTLSEKLIILQPKEAVLVDLKLRSTTKSEFRTDIYSAWKDGELVFSGESPQKVFERLERTFNKTFRFNPTIFEDKKLTAHFQKGESLERILEVTSKALNINIRETPTGIVITERPKNLQLKE